jgi:hypothetical protein
MFDVFYFGPKPNLFAFEKPASNLEDAAQQSKTSHYWYIYGDNDYAGFDFDYTPVPWEKDHLHVWPSQHQRNGEVYLANKDTVDQRQWHYRTEQGVTRNSSSANWTVPDYIVDTVDRSWHPDPESPPYVYHFPSQHQSASGVTYTVPGATAVKLSDAFVFTAKENLEPWITPDTIDEHAVDYSWHPNVLDPAYIYHFGSEWQETTGLAYTVLGATEIKLMGPAPSKTGNVVQTPTVFFINKHNPLAESRLQGLKDLGVKVINVRYFSSMFETIKRCANKSKTRLFWAISSENDYSEFDFTWHPNTWQQYMTHVFASKWNKWSDTFLINKFEFARHSEWAKTLEEIPNLNFVQDQIVKTADDSSAMYYVDHGNDDARFELPRLQKKYPNIRTTRFVDNYLDTFKRIIATATTEHVWILNSVCDYSNFDFTWQPGAWEREQIHCFCNNKGEWNEKRGDTFYIPVEVFKSQMYELELLDWFNVISYNASQNVTRWNIPTIEYQSDNLVEEIKNYNFTTPYALFSNRDFAGEHGENVIDCLWTEKDRTVRPYSQSGGIVLVPRDVKKYLKTQMYDYPYLYKYDEGLPYNYYADNAIDVVYISNGEPDADKYFEHLKTVLGQKHVVADFPRFANKLHRVSNVNGRVAAYQAAAQASTSHWFFAVFAKLEVDKDFDFNWQPDYWQEPKHYIFNAKNPVNGLEYGHMGMIAYNKRLVLANNNPGIDFTLSQPHETVPKLSGVAHFNQDAWTTWRTAFRETLKLRMFMETNPTLETEHRLETWRTVAAGNYSNYSIDGANDAIAYYEESAGDPDKLQLSFEWAWLRARYDAKY